MRKSAVPIIIGGFYRSGTLWPGSALPLQNFHSHIHCGPEVKFFKDFYGDYLNDDLAHVRFFSTARSYGFSNSDLLSPIREHLHPISRAGCSKRGQTKVGGQRTPRTFFFSRRMAGAAARRVHFSSRRQASARCSCVIKRGKVSVEPFRPLSLTRPACTCTSAKLARHIVEPILKPLSSSAMKTLSRRRSRRSDACSRFSMSHTSLRC